jgi:hypothetical protein
MQILLDILNKDSSAKLANYQRAMSESNSVTKVSKTEFRNLFDRLSSFKDYCYAKMKEAKEKHSQDVNKRKGWRDKNVHPLSNSEIISRYAQQMTQQLSGYFPAPYDPNGMINAFDRLHLKSGFHIESYQHYSSGGNHACVYVVPDGNELPEKPPTKVMEAEFRNALSFLEGREMPKKSLKESILSHLSAANRPLPDFISGDVSSFIEGDCSPLSFFQASIYRREIYELGSTWHNLSWGLHNMFYSADELPQEDWTWDSHLPNECCPVIWKDDSQKWNVTFYTYKFKYGKVVYYNDTFLDGYKYITFTADMGSYPSAIMF